MPLSDSLIDEKAIQMNALALAFVGDAVFERYVRELAVSLIPGAKVVKLHFVCASVVNCRSQAKILSRIEELLDETEKSVVRRGMNSKPQSIPKHAEIGEYLRATGFEALLGYLELSGKDERLLEVLEMCREMICKMITEASADGRWKK